MEETSTRKAATCPVRRHRCRPDRRRDSRLSGRAIAVGRPSQTKQLSSRASAVIAIPPRALAFDAKPLPTPVEANLRAPADRDGARILAVLAKLERLGDPRRPPVVLGSFDEQATSMTGAGLGDRTAPDRPGGGVLARHDAEIGRELGRVAEATKVANLGAEAERGQGADPAQAAQSGDRLRPGAFAPELPRSRGRALDASARGLRPRRGSRAGPFAATDRRARSRPATFGARPSRLPPCPGSGARGGRGTG